MRRIWLLLGCLVVFPVSAAFSAVEMQVVVLPTCQYCWPVENAVQLLAKKYGSQLKVSVRFFVETDKGGEFYSRLGQTDFDELSRQAWVREKYPDKLWPYILARNSEMYSPIWEHAAQWAKIPPDRLKLENEKVKASLKQDAELVMRHKINKAPAIIINGEKIFEGEIGLAELDVAVQARLTPGKKNLIQASIVYDPAAPQTHTLQAQEYLKQFIPGIQSETIPLTTDLEKKLIDTGVNSLPAVLMPGDFFKGFYANYLEVNSSISINGRPCLLLPKYADTLINRPFVSGRFQVIMQAHCPGAGKLLGQLISQKNVHMEPPLFLFDKQPGDGSEEQKKDGVVPVYTAFHGQAELQETVRQLVIIKNFPEKYWQYAAGLYTKGGEWSSALKQAGLDRETIERLAQEQQAVLLDNHYQEIRNIPVLQSPELLIDNRYLVTDIAGYFGGKVTLEGTCGQ